jgi:hypothetical protein
VAGHGEMGRKMTMVEIMCTHVSKCKYLLKLLQECGGMKESSGEGEFKYDIFDTL